MGRSATSRSVGCIFFILLLLALPAAAQNIEFTQTSIPAGVVNQTTYPLPNATVSTVTAPDPSSNYRFTHWTINEVRAADPSGGAANPAAFTITAPVSAVANYTLAATDSDADTLPDWWELRYFGNLAQTATGNPDGDGYDNAAEHAASMHPSLANEFVAGGISRRRGDIYNVDVGVGDPTYYYGGVSRRRSATVTAVINTATYAILTESSDPAGVIAQTRVIMKGNTVNLTTPPDPFSGYRFTGWLVGGVRFDAPTQVQPTPITVNTNTSAVARYISETADTDGDGVADWQEWLLFNSLIHTLASDPDSDGWSWADELFRGYSPVAANLLEPGGGVSRRRSAMFSVDTTGRLPYRLTSDPATILEQTEYLAAGSAITVPEKNGHTFSNYKFSWWDLNGTRKQDPSGAALGQFSFVLNVPATATAHYYDPAADTDNDTISDWHEWTFYGSLAQTTVTDTDGDGWTYLMELLRSQSPQAVDLLDPGSVSRRRSVLTAVNAVFLPNPPAIGVNAARDITQRTARLSALVNPIGSPCTLTFQHGLTTAYGAQTPPQNLGSGLQAITGESLITGLTPDTLYHFRAVAANGEGTTTGSNYTFRTLPENYASWAAFYGAGASTDDPDLDGLMNLLEFATGGHPLQGGDISMGVTITDSHWDLRYTRQKYAVNAGVRFTVEWSETMAPSSWSAAGVTQTILVDGSEQQMQALVPTGMARRFVRLRVTLP